MRVFEHGNWIDDVVCPICKTAKDEPVVLVPIPGTEDGGIVGAQQIHEKCVRMIVTMYVNQDWT